MRLPVNAFTHFLLYLSILPFAIFNKAVAQDFSNRLSTQSGAANTGFPSNALVLLAQGSEKYIKDVRAGDVIAAYDPLAEGYISTMVRSVKKQESQSLSMVSVMLILEDLSVSLHANGGLAGLTLQASAEQKVMTDNGIKSIGQIQEGEKLYCFDETSGQFLAFSVYAIQKTVEVVETYSLETESNSCLINNTVMINYE